MKNKILLLLKGSLKFQDMIKDYLGREGFEVDPVRSVAEVFHKLKRSPHFLLIVEQDNYEMDCLELFLNVRDIQSNIHVMFLGSGNQENKEEIIKLGGIYFESPVEADKFRETIKELSRASAKH